MNGPHTADNSLAVGIKSRSSATQVVASEARLELSNDGRSWRVPPGLIDSFQKGDPSNLPAIERHTDVQCDPDGLKDCEVGDVVLMWRGLFDVVKIVSLTTTTVRCRVLGGRTKGKIYGYKPEWFVQKLNKERIAA